MPVCHEEHELHPVFVQNSTPGTYFLLLFLGGIVIQVKTLPSSRPFVVSLNDV